MVDDSNPNQHRRGGLMLTWWTFSETTCTLIARFQGVGLACSTLLFFTSMSWQLSRLDEFQCSFYQSRRWNLLIMLSIRSILVCFLSLLVRFGFFDNILCSNLVTSNLIGEGLQCNSVGYALYFYSNIDWDGYRACNMYLGAPT